MSAFIQGNLFLLACISAGLCVAFAAYVIIDFVGFTSARYKEKYIQETAIVMDDVLLQMPPGRILDLSLALAALAGFLVIGLLFLVSESPTVGKLVISGLIAAVAAFPLPRVYLRYLSNVRMKKFNEQLEDALLSMSSSLKAGFSIIRRWMRWQKKTAVPSPTSSRFSPRNCAWAFPSMMPCSK